MDVDRSPLTQEELQPVIETMVQTLQFVLDAGEPGTAVLMRNALSPLARNIKAKAEEDEAESQSLREPEVVALRPTLRQALGLDP